MKAAWIGVDVGGTSIKLGAITPEGERLAEASLHLPDAPTPQEVIALVLAGIKELLHEAQADATGIGVGLPGLLNRETHKIEQCPNLAWLEELDFRAELARALRLPVTRVVIENDANVAALGEQWLGASKGEPNVLTITLGTGIGGGLILGGQLFLCEGQAGEVGHMTVVPGGLACGCGSHGCLETVASGRAAERRARELNLPADSPGDMPLLCERARAQAGPERELLEAVGRDLGHGIGSVICLLDVRCFVIAGGFSAAFDLLRPGIKRGLSEWTYGARVAAIRLLAASLGSSAGWIGAARLLSPTPDPEGASSSPTDHPHHIQ